MKTVAIIGCGLIGNKRARQLAGAKLVAIHDIDRKKAEDLIYNNKLKDVDIVDNWQDIINRKDIDIVIVATMHNVLAEISLAAILSGKHVLVEKPVARNIEDISLLIKAAKQMNVLVRVGFNHRYHPAMLKAKEMVDKGNIGELMYVRARYGHGGRLGYDKEWRADPNLAAGGELVEQGIHIVDLAHYFLGSFVNVRGEARTYYWDQELDDNGFMLLKTANNQTAFLHVSCTEWKNTFSFEIYGKKGKLEANGLGGSYGLERLTWYRVREEMGPPDTTIWEYPQEDRSWEAEMQEFLIDIEVNRNPLASLEDAKRNWEVINKIYEQSGE